MDAQSSDTEVVVRRHLHTFLQQQGVDAIVSDYADDACFLSEDDAYRGKQAIGGFFETFIASLPAGAIREFALRSLRIDGDLAHITWSAGPRLPLGTDTFIVRDGKIVSQTVAIYWAPASA